ncbi:MAG: glycosyltransferase [Coriobacteriia bacterium]|nr:glycosyltransferase [Coriobacteriia bacterium]
MRTVALIPAHNEAERLAATLDALRSVRGIDGVIVVDDASTDDTAEIARRNGAAVVHLECNLGKGGALEAGVAEIGDPDVLLLLDGDLGDTASEAGALLAPVLDDVADMSIARFPRPAGKAGFGLVKGLARWGIRGLGGPFDAQAPLSGQRALNRAALQVCRPFESGYGVEVVLTVRALRAGLRIVEVETMMAHAATGRDLAGFAHRGQQFTHVVGALLRLARERAR